MSNYRITAFDVAKVSTLWIDNGQVNDMYRSYLVSVERFNDLVKFILEVSESFVGKTRHEIDGMIFDTIQKESHSSKMLVLSEDDAEQQCYKDMFQLYMVLDKYLKFLFLSTRLK